MARCTQGHDNHDGASFCGECGSPVLAPVAHCAGCGQPAGPGLKYCPRCGKPLITPGSTGPASVQGTAVGGLGDIGMVKDSTITTTANVDNRHFHGAPGVGGNVSFNIVAPSVASTPPTAFAHPPVIPKEHCPVCGRLVPVDGEHFRCKGCGRAFICLRHQHPSTYRCEECMSREVGTARQAEEQHKEILRKAAEEAATIHRTEESHSEETVGQEAAQQVPQRKESGLYPGLVSIGKNAQGYEEYEQKKSGVVFVMIPGGSFEMGSGEDDVSQPVHRVQVSDFLMARTPVTVAQYRAFCTATGRKMPDPPSWGWQDGHPVVNVDWNDAQAYCAWAGGRLPTEAEWEYAAGGGQVHQSWAGTDNGESLDEYAWYDKNSSNQTQPVRRKKPNLFGLYDMSGSVWEWCADWFGEDYYSHSPVDNPTGPTTGADRVFRGGGWHDDPRDARAAVRIGDDPGGRDDYVGFRLVAPPGQR